MNFSIKLSAPLGFTVIILLGRLESVNAVFALFFCSGKSSQLFGLRIVLYAMRHLLVTYGMLLFVLCLFSFYIVLSEKEIIVLVTVVFFLQAS